MAPKRRVLTLKEKVEVINSYDRQRCSIRELSTKFAIGKTQAADILRKREEILKQWHSNAVNINLKRNFFQPERKNLDQSVLEWFVKARNKNIPISGPIIMQKAVEIAMSLGLNNFHASRGWLEKFQRRHNICFKSISGESADVNMDDVTNFLSKLPDIIRNYREDCIYNADETGLFYRALPAKTFTFKNEKCTGGKLAKERLTILHCANMAGEKEKLLVIGKSARPRAFKNLDNNQLPVTWKFNKKSWMTMEIMSEWLKAFDRKMVIRKKKVLLFLDNAGSHPKNLNLENVKIVFLPPNTTGVCQPLDQGIIRNLIINHILANFDKVDSASGLAKKINVLDAAYFIKTAWERVTQETIRNCFKNSGFGRHFEIAGHENFEPEDDIPLSVFQQMSTALQRMDSLNTSVEDFIAMDYNVHIDGDENENNEDQSTVEDEEEEDYHDVQMESSIKTYQDVHSCIADLKNFAGLKSDGKAVEMLTDLQIHFEKEVAFSNKKQTNITDYFSAKSN